MPTNPETKSRGPGRPPGSKEKRKRKRRTIKVIPADKRWLNLAEAADDAGLSVGSLRKSLDKIGAKKFGRRRIIDRVKLHGWLASLPDGKPTNSEPEERVAAAAEPSMIGHNGGPALDAEKPESSPQPARAAPSKPAPGKAKATRPKAAGKAKPTRTAEPEETSGRGVGRLKYRSWTTASISRP